MGKQKKFFGRKVERNSRARRLVPPHIEFQIIDFEMFPLPLRSASQHRPHTGEQLGERERFHQIIVRAELESFYAIADAIAGGKK